MHYLLEHCSVLVEGFDRQQRTSAIGRQIRRLSGDMEFLVSQIQNALRGETEHLRDVLLRIQTVNGNGRKAIMDMVTTIQKLQL